MNEESDLCVLRYLVSLAAAMQIIIDVFLKKWVSYKIFRWFMSLLTRRVIILKGFFAGKE